MIQFSNTATPSTTCICSQVNGRPCEFHTALPYSVQRSDALTAARRARILAAVRRGIAQYEREQDAAWACAPEAWTPFLATSDDS